MLRVIVPHETYLTGRKTGWLSVLGWQAAFASICFLCGTLIQGLLVLNYQDYVSERWHGTLFTIAIAAISTFVNTYGATQLPTLEGLILILHIFGFFAVMIPLWVMAPRTPTETVFTEFTNAGGWSSMGLACLVGQLTPIFSFLGKDVLIPLINFISDLLYQVLMPRLICVSTTHPFDSSTY